MTWRCIFNNTTNRGVGCNRNPQSGEFAKDIPPQECKWFVEHPEGYMWDNVTKKLADWPNWESEKSQNIRKKKLEEDLLKIDKETEKADEQPFTFNGHLFYPDTEFIQGMYSVLPKLPANYTETWKTADKAPDGVNNIYVVLDKTGIEGLALAYLQFKKNNWSAGEAKKNILKQQFLGG